MTTIRRQLTRKLLLTLGLLLAAAGLAVYFSARTALLAQFDAALRTKALAITTLVEQKGDHLEMDFSDAHMPDFQPGGSDFFQLWRADKTPVERSASLGDTQLAARHGTAAAPMVWDLALPNGQPVRALGLSFRPQQSDEQPAQAGTEAILVVASARHSLDQTLLTLKLVLAGAGLLLLAGTALAVPRVLRRGLAPLDRLADQAARIDARSLSTRLPAENLPAELAPITARLNELLERLERSFERERQFSSDVAHELRTPVAELRTLAELGTKAPEARLANTDQEVLAIALHLENMLQQLLALSRGEDGKSAVQKEQMALSPLLQDVCERFKSRATERGVTLNATSPSEAQAHTDPALLRSILTNLVSNAVEYTPTGGTVELEAQANCGGLSLRVVNTVSDLEEADLPHLFERFWRKDAARCPNGHTGLGLSLARQFARSLDCELTATFVAPNRLALTLSPQDGHAVDARMV